MKTKPDISIIIPVYNAGKYYADSLYTDLGTRELYYNDHGTYESVGSHHWYYKH